jgi:hypothetical protein
VGYPEAAILAVKIAKVASACLITPTRHGGRNSKFWDNFRRGSRQFDVD